MTAIHPRDITSTMVDLAVRGYIKIEETAEKVLLFTHKDYIFHLLKPQNEWGADLAPHERVMLENVFAGGQETRLSSLKNRFYTAVPVIRQDIMASLKNKGIYLLDPESANGYSIVAAIAILVLFGILQYLGWANFFNSAPLLIVCGADFGCDLVAVCARHDRKDGEGSTGSGCGSRLPGVHESRGRGAPEADAADYIREISRLRDGVGSGASLGAGLCGDRAESAAWYVGPGGTYGTGFNPIFFSSSMHSMARDMHQVFVSAPRASSGGSGFRWRWRGGILGRRIRRWWRQRVLVTRPPCPLW